MHMRIFQLGKGTIKRLLGMDKADRRIEKIYAAKEYLEAYSQHTDLRVKANPQLAVGGKWEKIGQLQFEFLINKGLHPHHQMLDLGCGTLRGGRHFIKYLNKSNYYGMDISPEAIAYAKKLVRQEKLLEKNPNLLISKNKDLKFREFSNKTFDYILAQSVFTHLKPENIKECFENIGNIMQENSVFYFTYSKSKVYRQIGFKDFGYPFSFFESFAEQCGFKLKDCSQDYNHPRGQLMIELMKI